MKVLYSLFFAIGYIYYRRFQSCQENTMALLDEKVKEINISKSRGIGDMNQDIFLSINDRQSIKVFEKAIKTVIKQKSDVNNTKPDYDVMVGYEGEFPTHAIHLWLGEENEKSILMYMVGEGKTYITSSKATNGK